MIFLTKFWRPALPGDWLRLRRLLIMAEPAWLSLIDRLDAAAPWWHRRVWVLDFPGRPAQILACCHISDGGLAIFAADPATGPKDWHLDSLVQLARKALSRLYCLIGLSHQVAALQKQLGFEALSDTRYQVMSKRCQVAENRPESARCIRPLHWPPEPSGYIWRGLEIRRVQEPDTDALIELQCQYEIEEVLVAGHQLNRVATRRILALNLREQCVFAVSNGREMVAKAGTNGCSWNYVQIGGVFTLPAWRRKGISEQLMEALLSEILERGYHASLFVKQHNTPALGLYEKLGFEACGELVIAYY